MCYAAAVVPSEQREQREQAKQDKAEPQADHRLAQAEAAFVRGDYRELRTLCDELLGSDTPATDKAAARELRRRTEVDPVQVSALLACLALLLLIAYKYVL